MSIELNKDILKIEEIRGKEETQVLVETEVYVAPSKPPITKIMWVDGTVDILSTKVISNRVLVSGVVKFKVVYKGEGDEIYTIDSNVDFKEEVQMENITENMSARIKSHIEYIEEEVLDEKKLSLKALVNLDTKVELINDFEVIKDMGEKEYLQIQREKMKYKEIQGRETCYAFVKESIEIDEDNPEIEEVLKISITAYEEEVTVVDDRIILSGIVSPKVIYYGDGKISTIENEIHFNHFIEMPGAVEGSNSEINIEVIDGSWEVGENDEGELKVLDMEIKLRIFGSSFLEREKELIVDLYSTNEKLNIVREQINLIENLGNYTHKESVVKELEEYNIKEVYQTSVYPTLVDSMVEESGIRVEAVLALQTIYLEDGTDEIKTFNDEVPYRYYLPQGEQGEKCEMDVELLVESVKVDSPKNPKSLEVVINHKIKLNRNRIISVIKEVEETGDILDKSKGASIIIYIVQKGDTLWDIAKRYNTTTDEILAENENITPGNIIPGDKIIIEKKVDIKF